MKLNFKGACLRLLDNTIFCQCNPPYSGDRCQNLVTTPPPLNPCSSNPCINGNYSFILYNNNYLLRLIKNNKGVCNRLSDTTFSCSCNPGFTGQR